MSSFERIILFVSFSELSCLQYCLTLNEKHKFLSNYDDIRFGIFHGRFKQYSLMPNLPTKTLIKSEENAFQACIEQEGASKVDADVVRKLNVPQTYIQKCLYACMFEQSGTSDGQQFDKETFLANAGKMANVDQKAVQRMADRCDGVENDDRCELAADIVACLSGRKRS